ncbi:MAG: Holliday junction branch migration DNA helicase RuvB [Acholeplasmatales bacterium]|jgi:Holliday junction DNA helicase RuvB|nr:Holliday junction branch migration DNA helicase RuvB [Acholeplasmataceae bacterium]MDY0115454.1 Holliday junction branch migration DNA helicase RuvB [Acholeplasmatales bacterium]MCK9234014.1 Holliday junction branch migration DNA helicase RuvB [Acholeplasmataceae bacterium]MCK9289610.1 Holliday junction branch migration DNA helicase RuvB [Acholeplasmataceae bacterium]MCK9427636.1 Holliday junction branch migration DNA helicase RuvB [Acholeplasmataceae bacterium]
MKDERVISSLALKEDEEKTLRPQTLKEYVGQTDLKEMLNIYIKAAKKRNEAIDHILFYGPPGLGKTTLAQIVSNEMEVSIKITSGPAIERSGDLAAILTSLEPGDVLFIDEIHRLPRVVEEVLYAAMEDYAIDILIGRDAETRSIRIDLPPFTLVGATTRLGELSAPLRERFGVTLRLDFYNLNEIADIIRRTARVYDNKINPEAVIDLAKRSRGTPRIANRLFRRVRDFAEIMSDGIITYEITQTALKKLGIDESGLDLTDKTYLRAIIEKFAGGPVGVEAISAAIFEDVNTIEDVYEPFLLQEGYIQRTARGRIALEKSYQLLKIKYLKGIFEK